MINLKEFKDFVTDYGKNVPTMINGVAAVEALNRAIAAEAEVVELKAALTLIMRAAEGAKDNCYAEPTIENVALASIAAVAAQGLGLLKGPKLSEGV